MLMSENGDPSRSGGRDIKDSRLAGNRPEQTAHCYTEGKFCSSAERRKSFIFMFFSGRRD